MTKYITDNAALEQCVSQLNAAESFSIDLEFDKNHYRYGFNLCLMQILCDGQCYLIDPLSKGLDIALVFPPIENPEIIKVVYTFGEDLRLLHNLGCSPKNIFDLSIAASLLDYQQASLSNILNTVLGIEVGKSAQKSNWFLRPLTDRQMQYAAEDVLHLPALKKALDQLAETRGVMPWIKEENAVVDTVVFHGIEKNVFLKEKDKKDLNEVEWHVLKNILTYREEKAEFYNKPSYQIFTMEYLKQVVRNPKVLQQWKNTKGIFRKVKTPEVQAELKALLEKGLTEAQELKLSPKKPAIPRLSYDEVQAFRRERTHFDRLKKEVFAPVKKSLAEDYGEHTAAYIFGNRFIQAFISADESKLLSYKKNLLEKYIAQNGIEMSKYLSKPKAQP